MFKNRTKNIVSKLFDTINKILPNESQSESDSNYDSNDSDSNDSDSSDDIDIIDENEPSLLKYSVDIPFSHCSQFHLKKNVPIMICIYQVRTDGLYPFIQFLLSKDDHTIANDHKVSFITFSSMNDLRSERTIKTAIINYIETKLPQTQGSLTYDGYYEMDNTNIVILNYHSNQNSDLNLSSLIKTNYVWAISFEILNLEKVGNYCIQQNVIDFFKQNKSFLVLKTPENIIYESPIIGYYIPRHYTSNIEEMDIYRETIIPELGKCYYLYVNQPEFTDKLNKEIRIMRIGFFAGTMIIYNGKKIYTNYDSALCKTDTNKLFLLQNYNQHAVLEIL